MCLSVCVFLGVCVCVRARLCFCVCVCLIERMGEGLKLTPPSLIPAAASVPSLALVSESVRGVPTDPTTSLSTSVSFTHTHIHSLTHRLRPRGLDGVDDLGDGDVTHSLTHSCIHSHTHTLTHARTHRLRPRGLDGVDDLGDGEVTLERRRRADADRLRVPRARDSVGVSKGE